MCANSSLGPLWAALAGRLPELAGDPPTTLRQFEEMKGPEHQLEVDRSGPTIGSMTKLEELSASTREGGGAGYSLLRSRIGSIVNGGAPKAICSFPPVHPNHTAAR